MPEATDLSHVDASLSPPFLSPESGGISSGEDRKDVRVRYYTAQCVSNLTFHTKYQRSVLPLTSLGEQLHLCASVRSHVSTELGDGHDVKN